MFPAAARPADEPHPPSCPCLPCIDALIADVTRPLVMPEPRTDPAAGDRKDAAYGDWLANRPNLPTAGGPVPEPRTEYVDDVTRHDIWPDGWRPGVGYVEPEANRGTRGPGTGGGAGRRPSGPGRRRTPGTAGGEGRPGGCASATTALVALVLVAMAAAAGLVWLAAH
ncbi:hypothetical protein GA0070604_0123 [Micromonospora eburnea]|uniref:Uncharacterized protein n=2 Tax=Micromonospora eburnea TaxID=227316 RepID=A0A1C6TQR7_9ACTN|nr:hypothetical protein GA0070604_0017 [Micromonospora eburnea]SCL43979.1 hypothetical protein GA0070604_0123 [Micromonospora eburnea]